MKGRVVIVEDGADQPDSTSAALTAEGYEVSRASGTDQALALIESRRPDAIVYGVLSPANGVIEFVRRLALDRSALLVPVVMVTALSEYQIQSFLNGVPGVRRVLYAPCTPEALRRAIEHVVPRRAS